jgi:hypothetical protein
MMSGSIAVSMYAVVVRFARPVASVVLHGHKSPLVIALVSLDLSVSPRW